MSSERSVSMVCLLQEFKWTSEIDCLGHHSRVVLTTDLIKKMKNSTLEDLMKTLQIATTTSYHSINDLPMSSTSSTVHIHKKQCVKFTFSVLHSREQRNMGAPSLQSFALPAMLFLFSLIIIPQHAEGGITRHYHFDVHSKGLKLPYVFKSKSHLKLTFFLAYFSRYVWFVSHNYLFFM